MKKTIIFISIILGFAPNAVAARVFLIPHPESTGVNLGAALGTGLGAFFGHKLRQRQQRKQAQRFKQNGLPEVLGYLDPQVQAAYLQDLGAAQQRFQQEAQLRQRLEELAYLKKAQNEKSENDMLILESQWSIK